VKDAGKPQASGKPKLSENDKLVQRAERLMPGGVSSPVRAFKAVGGKPRFIARGEGARIWDVEGREYVDFQLSFGPLIHGHAFPAVGNALAEAAHHGTSFGAPTEREVELAEIVTARHPAMKWVRFVNSGTEAVMSAIRLARAATNRTLILKFEGCYHGHADSLLVKAGSGLVTFGEPTSAGVPQSVVQDTATLPLNDDVALETFFHAYGERVACAIIEALPANNGLLPQRPEWLRKLEKLCKENGALFIVDEVITGFRLGWGGASSLYGLKPDLVTLGKVIGGGLPVGAYGGRSDLMKQVAPLGGMYQAGTLSGNPLAMAAGIATLRALEQHPDPFGMLATRTKTFTQRVREIAADRQIPCTVVEQGSLFWIVLDQIDAQPRSPSVVKPEAVKRFARFHHACLQHGVFLPPSAYEVEFMSLAHDNAALDDALRAMDMAFAEVQP